MSSWQRCKRGVDPWLACSLGENNDQLSSNLSLVVFSWRDNRSFRLELFLVVGSPGTQSLRISRLSASPLGLVKRPMLTEGLVYYASNQHFRILLWPITINQKIIHDE
eukprot:TRINITY_DN8808_c0_g1_i5.p1 TRINITY_DN8808_c0_g1~~TRINITY_DN8808_c0_g1_i5.p1  ORF type:complete len:108 (+),score=14.32 TRINITY_DN8808_c0_g1_i5:95-418(+)